MESVDLAIMSTETTFVAEEGVFAAWDLTNIGLAMFFLVLSASCKSGIGCIGEFGRVTYFRAASVGKTLSWAQSRITHFSADLSPMVFIWSIEASIAGPSVAMSWTLYGPKEGGPLESIDQLQEHQNMY